MSERLTPKDAAILDLEDEVSAAHGLTVGVFEGPEPTFDELFDLVSNRVRLVPRYRQRLKTVPFGIERPVWVDDPTFSVDFHFRHTALPDRQNRGAFNAFVSRQLSQRLDQHKPLWELWFVSRLPKGRWALVSKVHYSIIDGVSGTDLLGLLTSDDAEPLHEHHIARALPSDGQLFADAVVDMVTDPLEAYRAARGVVNKPIRLVRHLAGKLSESRDPDGLGRAVGPHRRWQPAELELDDIRKVRKKHGCSTTDVILAAVTSGIRSYLVENGKPVPETIEALVPLAVDAATGGLSGQVTSLTAHLPIGTEDPVERLKAIHHQTAPGAEATGAIAGHILRRQDHFVAPSVLAQGVRSAMLAARDRTHVDTVAINVPGPEHTVEVLGRPMVEAYPVIPLPSRMRIAIAAMSLSDHVYFGITSDWDSTKGLRHAAAGVNSTLTDLGV